MLGIGGTDNSGILMLTHLFSEQYQPAQIRVFHPPNQKILEFFCDRFCIQRHEVKDNKDLESYIHEVELIVNIGGFPFLISNDVIKKIPNGIVNLHTSILEEYRGRWMASWVIINNEKYTGYTWHYINHAFDAGNILDQQIMPVESSDTAFSLNHKILLSAVQSLKYVIDQASTKNLGYRPQKLGQYYKNTKPFGGIIQKDWAENQIRQFIKAMYYPPMTSAVLVKDDVEYPVNTYEMYEKYVRDITRSIS